MKRRKILQAGLAAVALSGADLLQPVYAREGQGSPGEKRGAQDDGTGKDNRMRIHYLEIVTTDVEAVCNQYSQVYGVTFGAPDNVLGGARTAELASGGRLGIRPPLRPTEKPVVRPYMLVKDIQASVAAAARAGAKVALPPTRLGGYGQCAIVIQGGIEGGLWQP